MSARRSGADRLATLILRSGEWVGMHLPRRQGLAASRAFMRLDQRQGSSRARTVAANLSRVLGHPADSPLVRAATREAFDLYARYWYETFALRTMSMDEVNGRFSVTGVEHMDDALALGRGVVMALPHMGNWDAAGHWLAVNGYRMTAVAEELKPPEVFDLFYRHRRALGMDIVPLSEGRRVAELLVGVLADNRVLTLVADRNLSGRGVAVELFGETMLMPSGPAYLSLGTGAPLLPSVVFTTPDGWHTHIDPPVRIERTNDLRADVAAATRVVAAHFERYISSAPTDWHMFQPVWPDTAREAPASGTARTVESAAAPRPGP